MNTQTPYDSANPFDLAEAFLSACGSMGRSPRTVQTYRDAIEVLRQWRTADANLETLTKLEGRAFTKHLLERFTPGGAAMRMRSLKAFYGWLVREEEIEKSPLKGIVINVPEVPQLTATDEQVTAMLARARKNPRDYLILMVMTTTGARKGEVAALEFGDMDLANRLVTIRTSKTTPRIVPMSDATAVAFTRWARRRGTGSGSLWSVADPYSLIERTVRGYSQGQLGSHALRRYFACSWLAKGGSEIGLQRTAGWAGPEMIRTYTRANGADLARDEHRRLFA